MRVFDRNRTIELVRAEQQSTDGKSKEVVPWYFTTSLRTAIVEPTDASVGFRASKE